MSDRLVLALILLVALPVLIGAAAFVEEKFYGGNRIAEACRAIGIFRPLRQIALWFGAS